MNPVVLYFASGDSLYAGAVLLLLAIVISRYLRQRRWLRLRNLVAWLGLASMVMACPPFSWTVDAIFLAAFVLWLISANQWLGSPSTKWRSRSTAVLLIVVLTLIASELPRRRIPAIVGIPTDHLVVIGDSISSGIDSHVPAWPLIEIGGNDLLGGVPSVAFEKNLDATLSKLAMPGRTMVMFELPLLPHKIAYGQIQRRLAAKYGVWLIPKRCFVEVIGGANATSDGLHLSESGARRMAKLVAMVLSPVLKSNTAGTSR